MNCERCGKRLSRKTARQIGGVVMCSACLFPPMKRDGPAETIDGFETGNTVAPNRDSEGPA